MKITSLLKTSTFQLSLLYLILFAGSVFLLLGFIYWSTAGYMSSQTAETIGSKIKSLQEVYRRHGAEELVEVVADIAVGDTDRHGVYLLTDGGDKFLAGNIPRWPVITQKHDGFFQFEIHGANGSVRKAEAAQFVFPKGLRLLVGRDISTVSTIADLIRRALYWGSAITLGLGLAGAFIMTFGVMRRIEQINATSRQIMTGDLSQRIPVTGSGDDFDQLAENLNTMLSQIEKLMEGIRNVSNNIAHDLKTPLTRLRGRLDQLQGGLAEDAEGITLAQGAIEECDKLLGTFNALLRIARIESGGHQHLARVNLGKLVQDACDLYLALAEEKSQHLSFDADSECEIAGDKHLLFQLVVNLLDNAVKYAPEGGEIRVGVARENGRALVTVADNGAGIPAGERDDVLQRFYRVDKSRHLPGAGLGLSLVAAVVESHEAELRLEDNCPGLRVVVEFSVDNEQTARERS